MNEKRIFVTLFQFNLHVLTTNKFSTDIVCTFVHTTVISYPVVISGFQAKLYSVSFSFGLAKLKKSHPK